MYPVMFFCLFVFADGDIFIKGFSFLDLPHLFQLWLERSVGVSSDLIFKNNNNTNNNNVVTLLS